MPNKRGRWRDQLLDLFILISSVVMLLLSVAMLIYCAFFLQITNIKPYIEYVLLFILSVWGFRMYRKEVEL